MKIRDLERALEKSVVFSREKQKYKVPDKREIFLHNYRNIEELMTKNSRRRYKSNTSVQNPLYKGVVVPPELIGNEDPISIPEDDIDSSKIPCN